MSVYLIGQTVGPLLVAVAIIFFAIGRQWERVFPTKLESPCPYGAECLTCNKSQLMSQALSVCHVRRPVGGMEIR